VTSDRPDTSTDIRPDSQPPAVPFFVPSVAKVLWLMTPVLLTYFAVIEARSGERVLAYLYAQFALSMFAVTIGDFIRPGTRTNRVLISAAIVGCVLTASSALAFGMLAHAAVMVAIAVAIWISRLAGSPRTVDMPG
jgi:hypothetical protein